MQYLSRLLFNFDGKIARTDYWIAFILLRAVSVCATLAIQPDYFTGDVTRPLPLAVLTLALMVPQYAMCAKRFRDIEWPVWLAFAIVGASTAATIAIDSPLTADGTAGNLALSIALIALVLAEIVPCGFFKGPAFAVNVALAR
jgi:uncharacterized membrane protein YhaH (DUF805 family)